VHGILQDGRSIACHPSYSLASGLVFHERHPVERYDLRQITCSRCRAALKKERLAASHGPAEAGQQPAQGRKVYLSAAMSGIEDENRPAMAEAAQALRKLGYEVHNPGDYDQWPAWCMERSAGPEPRPDPWPDPKVDRDYWRFCLRNDLQAIMSGRFGMLVVMPGWDASDGARLEVFVAARLMDMPVCRLTGTGRGPALERIGGVDLVWSGEAGDVPIQ